MMATPIVNYESRTLPVDEIVVPDGRRHLDAKTVGVLIESIEKIGLQIPITVRMVDDHPDEDGELGRAYVLVTGGHRLEAFRQRGERYIPSIIRECTETEAELWEISENLHRSELNVMERGEQVKRWRFLTLAKGGESFPPLPGGRQPNDKGYKKTARELGIDYKEVRNLDNIASLSDEAKTEAKTAGLDNNQSVLLAAHKDGVEAAKLQEAEEDKRRVAAEAERARIKKEAEARADKKADKQHEEEELRGQAEEVIGLLGEENMPYLLALLEGSPKKLAAAIRRLI